MRVFGRPQLDLGDTLSASDAPEELLNGEGYIRSIQHIFDQRRGFVTDLRVSLKGGGA